MRRAALAGALLAALLAAPRLLGQDEPTPFWMPDAPSKSDAPDAHDRAERTAKKRKKAPPREDESGEPAPAQRAKKRTTRHRENSAPVEAPPREPDNESPGDAADRPAEPAEAPDKRTTRHRYAPLPPLPHLEPEAVPPPQRAPAAPARVYPPAAQPDREAIEPPDDMLVPRSQPEPAAPASAPPVYGPRQPQARPVPVQSAPYLPPAAAPGPGPSRVLSIDEEQRGASATAASDESGERPAFRRFTLELLGGVWARSASDGQSRDWQLAYGLDFGVGLFRWLQLDVRGMRSSGTDGNAYASATTSHLMFDARLFGVVDFGPVALFAGGGGGLALEQTQLFLQDINSDPSQLSSSGLEPLGEFGGGVWLRPWAGLTFKLEADGLLRQGNLEPLFLFGIGWAF